MNRNFAFIVAGLFLVSVSSSALFSSYRADTQSAQLAAAVQTLTTSNAVNPNIGANKFDLALQYLGRASGANGSEAHRAVTAAMGKKSIIDARAVGTTFMRVAITGHSAGDMALWRSDPHRYWTLMDTMFVGLRGSNMKIVPVFHWNWVQFPEMQNDTTKNLLTNPQSPSYLLLTQYVREFITRYKSDPSILFYELTNELNLAVDLDQKKRCIERWGVNGCNAVENVTTDDMIGFTSALSAYIRTLDSTRLISSGFSIPRAGAEHLRARPEWSTAGPDWTLDSQAQFEKNITDTNQGLDIVSVHLYSPANARFGTTAATLSVIKNITDSLGKKLYVGEFGLLTNPTLVKDVLKSVIDLAIPYASPWAWELYRPSVCNPTLAENLEPGYTDDLIDAIRQTNVQLGNTPASSSAPQVLITRPFNASSITSDQWVCVLASGGDGKKVARVDFLLDGVVKSSVSAPPYHYLLPKASLTVGEHTVVARAYSTTGTTADSEISIQVASPTATLTASPTSIFSGRYTELSWRGTNATSCTASGGWTGIRATGGFISVKPSITTTYSITCTGSGGTSPKASATVTVMFPTGSIDWGSLMATSTRPTITGTATNAPYISLVINGSGSLSGIKAATLTNGRWSYTPPSAVTGTNYRISVYAGYFSGDTVKELAEGYLSIPTASMQGTATFNGTNQYIALPTLPDSQAFTMSAWVNYTGSGCSTVFSDATEVVGSDVVLAVDSSNIYIRADKNGTQLLGTPGGAACAPLGLVAVPLGKSISGSFHHIAWVNSYSNSSVYLDGVFVRTISLKGSNVGYHNVAPSIGRMFDRSQSSLYMYATHYFKGTVGDLRYYNFALSPYQVWQMFSSGSQYPTSITPISVANCGTLAAGATFLRGQSLQSCNGTYTLVLQPFDGKLILVKDLPLTSERAIWQADTSGTPAAMLKMQSDGNLVLYDVNNNRLWSSAGNGVVYGKPAYLTVGDNGNLTIKDAVDNSIVWQSNTTQAAVTKPSANIANVISAALAFFENMLW